MQGDEGGDLLTLFVHLAPPHLSVLVPRVAANYAHLGSGKGEGALRTKMIYNLRRLSRRLCDIMATIEFEGQQRKVPDYSPLLEPCEDMGVPFGCTAGECGTCCVYVESGMENLEPKNYAEESLSLGESERLCCQLKIKTGTVRLAL
jgi:ferredoxin